MRPERRTGAKFEVRGLGVDPVPSFVASSNLAACDKPLQQDAAIFPNRDVSEASQRRIDTLSLPAFYPSIEPKLGFEISEAALPGYEHGPRTCPVPPRAHLKESRRISSVPFVYRYIALSRSQK